MQAILEAWAFTSAYNQYLQSWRLYKCSMHNAGNTWGVSIYVCIQSISAKLNTVQVQHAQCRQYLRREHLRLHTINICKAEHCTSAACTIQAILEAWEFTSAYNQYLQSWTLYKCSMHNAGNTWGVSIYVCIQSISAKLNTVQVQHAQCRQYLRREHLRLHTINICKAEHCTSAAGAVQAIREAWASTSEYNKISAKLNTVQV